MTIPSPTGSLEDTDPQVYVVGALKGGTGKTRLAMLLALILRTVFHLRVVVFDADSGSQTASRWSVKAKARGYTWDLEVIRNPFDTLHEAIDEVRARGNVDVIVVDVGGSNVEAFQSAVKRAHKLIVPLCPDEGDLEQAPKTRESALMAASRNTTAEGCHMYYVLSRCSTAPQSRSKAESREVLLSDDPRVNGKDGAYPLIDTDIPMLVAYERAYGRVPQMRRSINDEDCPRWRDLVGFVPMLMEAGILTKDQVLQAGLMTQREVEKVAV